MASSTSVVPPPVGLGLALVFSLIISLIGISSSTKLVYDEFTNAQADDSTKPYKGNSKWGPESSRTVLSSSLGISEINISPNTNKWRVNSTANALSYGKVDYDYPGVSNFNIMTDGIYLLGNSGPDYTKFFASLGNASIPSTPFNPSFTNSTCAKWSISSLAAGFDLSTVLYF